MSTQTLHPPELIFLDIAVARTRRETKKRHPRSTYGKRFSHHGKNSKPKKNRLSQGLYCLTIQPLATTIILYLPNPVRPQLFFPVHSGSSGASTTTMRWNSSFGATTTTMHWNSSFGATTTTMHWKEQLGHERFWCWHSCQLLPD